MIPHIVLMASLVTLIAFADTPGVKISERFGYDPADSTRFLQAALDSGLPKIVIDRQAEPWRTLPLKGHSNQTIVFEPGACLEAKRGEYKGTDAHLLTYHLATNITLTGGVGSEMRMWKVDYTNANKYARSEWRHAISLKSCCNVTIENLTVRGSGGDGLYLGQLGASHNKNILVRNVRFLDNNRQGVSVITADGLLIENCDLSDTWGTPPAAGIDFEANNPQQMFRNCRMRNCRLTGNQGRGIDISKWNLNSTSEPMDILIENCLISNNVTRFGFYPASSPFRDVGGLVTFRDCQFLDATQTADSLRNAERKYTSFIVDYKNCMVTDKTAPEGKTCINEAWPKLPIVDEDYWNELKILPVTFPKQVEVVDAHPGEFSETKSPYFRSFASFFVYAAEKGPIALKVRQLKMGRKKPLWTGSSEVLDQRGNCIARLSAPSEEMTEWRFEAPARGFYEIRARVGNHAIGILATTAPIAAVGGGKGFRNAVEMAVIPGELYFDVPEGTKRFVAALTSGGGRERVTAKLLAPNGAIEDEVESLERFKYRFVGGTPPAGLWKAEFSKPKQGVLEDFSVDLLGLPTVFFLTPEKRWIE